METLKRIKLGKIKELFESVNKKPIQNEFCNDFGVCILRAAYLAGESITNPDYRIGLTRGWDGKVKKHPYSNIDELKYKLGYADGVAAWKEVNE